MAFKVLVHFGRLLTRRPMTIARCFDPSGSRQCSDGATPEERRGQVKRAEGLSIGVLVNSAAGPWDLGRALVKQNARPGPGTRDPGPGTRDPGLVAPGLIIILLSPCPISWKQVVGGGVQLCRAIVLGCDKTGLMDVSTRCCGGRGHGPNDVVSRSPRNK